MIIDVQYGGFIRLAPSFENVVLELPTIFEISVMLDNDATVYSR